MFVVSHWLWSVSAEDCKRVKDRAQEGERERGCRCFSAMPFVRTPALLQAPVAVFLCLKLVFRCLETSRRGEPFPTGCGRLRLCPRDMRRNERRLRRASGLSTVWPRIRTMTPFLCSHTHTHTQASEFCLFALPPLSGLLSSVAGWQYAQQDIVQALLFSRAARGREAAVLKVGTLDISALSPPLRFSHRVCVPRALCYPLTPTPSPSAPPHIHTPHKSLHSVYMHVFLLAPNTLRTSP